METADVQARLTSLEVRARRAEQKTRICIFVWLVTFCFALLSLKTKTVHSEQRASDTLRVHQLVILDEQGRDRIVIAAPLPNPMVNGKVGIRRNVVSAGVQFKDPNGNERGGIAALDDGSFLFGIDDETGRERAHLYYIPKRGSGVYLQGEEKLETVSLLIPPGGGTPKLEMTDTAGKAVAVVSTRR